MIGGFWYGTRDAQGHVGYRAQSGEKVGFILHGGGFAETQQDATPSFSVPAAICKGLLEYIPIFRPAISIFIGIAFRCWTTFSTWESFPRHINRRSCRIPISPRFLGLNQNGGELAGAIIAY